MAGVAGFFWFVKDIWLTDRAWSSGRIIGLRVSLAPNTHTFPPTDYFPSIVEYQTRDQAQNAVNTLSNQNLMGRLVYVREVSRALFPNTRAFLYHHSVFPSPALIPSFSSSRVMAHLASSNLS
jgi:hypothetical protein